MFAALPGSPGVGGSTLSNAAVIALAGLAATLLAGFVGFASAARLDARRENARAAREAASREAARQDRLAEVRHRLQLETLLGLQEELHALARLTQTLLVMDQQVVLDQERHPGLARVPTRASDDVYETVAAVRRLGSRLLDPVLRAKVTGFVETCLDAVLGGAVGLQAEREPRGVYESMGALIADLTRAYGAVMDAVGAALRAELEWGEEPKAEAGSPATEAGPDAAAPRTVQLPA